MATIVRLKQFIKTDLKKGAKMKKFAAWIMIFAFVAVAAGCAGWKQDKTNDGTKQGVHPTAKS